MSVLHYYPADIGGGEMVDNWERLNTWPELALEQLMDSGVARIVFDRQGKRNALNGSMVDAIFEALAIIRARPDLKVVITKGAGLCYGAGVDLHFLRSQEQGPLADWDFPGATIRLTQAFREFPRITIAQVHGYCLGGSMGLMNVHDLVFAADDAQIGMPEVARGSFGQIATSTLFHSQIPLKKAALIALTSKNVTGLEADRLGLVSLCAPASDLEAITNETAREIASRQLATLQHHKIAVQMGVDLSFNEALKIDQLVGARLAATIDPTAEVDAWLKSRQSASE